MNKSVIKQIVKEEISRVLKESSVVGNRADTLLYHGTSLNRAKKILRESENRSSDFFLYLADTEAATVQYSQRAVEDEEMDSDYEIEAEGCVIAFSLDALQDNQHLGIGELMNDYDDIWSLYKNGEISSPPSQVSWDESLELLGTCSYKGSLYKSIIFLKRIETGEKIFPSGDNKNK
tara:strand:- start:78 stop:608 length:531 start_codon:yes stop_codon:yes gene_type:complete